MQKYILQRILLAIPTIFIISILTFVILRVALPSSVVDNILGEYGRNDPALRQRITDELGLSASIPNQYIKYMGGVLTRLDLGKSLHNGRSVTSELKRRVPVSFELGLWGQAAAISFAIPIGVLAAVNQDRFADYGLRSFAILLNAVPGFWVAVLVITFGSIWFNWAPPITFKYLWEDRVQHLKIMMVPALIIGLTPSGGLLRLVRIQMLEVLRRDYFRTAHAKVLSQGTVLYQHALRNALI